MPNPAVKPLNSGDLRYPIVVQKYKKAAEQDDYGHANRDIPGNWVDHCSRRAKIRATGARQVVAPDNSVQISTITYEVRVRYDDLTALIEAKMRILWDGKILNIETADDEDGIKQQIVMDAVEETT